MNNLFQKYFGMSHRMALVTGASRGIGKSIAVALAGAGAEVCIHFNKSAKAAAQTVIEIQAAGGNAWSFGADLTVSDEAKKLAAAIKDRWGRLDVLVNNAGDLVKRPQSQTPQMN